MSFCKFFLHRLKFLAFPFLLSIMSHRSITHPESSTHYIASMNYESVATIFVCDVNEVVVMLDGYVVSSLNVPTIHCLGINS